MEEERQNQLKLAKKLALELSAWGINPEVGEDNIRDKKSDVNDGGKNDEEGNDVKDHDKEDNGEDYREATLNLSPEEVFFTNKYKVTQFSV